jgi:hypothetical protein
MKQQGNLAVCGRNGAGLVAAALLSVALAACAEDRPSAPPPPGGPRGEGRGGPPDGEGPPRRASLFVSPAGEPFRAEPGAPYPVAAWFIRADTNGDGKLSRDEFIADATRFFARLDADHNGVIDGFELKNYETEIVPEITADRQGPQDGAGPRPSQGGFGAGGGGPGRGRGGGGRRGGGVGGPPDGVEGGGGQRQGQPQLSGAAPYSLTADREPVAGADLDLNSRITLANFKTKAGQRFDRLDADMRGYLTLDALPKTEAQRQADRPRGRRPQ